MESKLNTRRQRCTYHAAGPEIVFLGVVYTPKPDAAQANPFALRRAPFYRTVVLERARPFPHAEPFPGKACVINREL